MVELLTVLGIIVLFVGSAGFALRPGSPGVALESAEAVMAGVVASARTAAMTNQSRALLVVNADSQSDRFLRGVQVAVETAPLSDHWRITGEGVLLPSGICVVPGSSELAGARFSPARGDATPWPSSRRSTLVLLPDDSVAASPENLSGRYLGLSDAFASSGGLAGQCKIVLADARRTPDGVVFEHPASVRGVVVGRYGAAILIHDTTGFDF